MDIGSSIGLAAGAIGVTVGVMSGMANIFGNKKKAICKEDSDHKMNLIEKIQNRGLDNAKDIAQNSQNIAVLAETVKMSAEQTQQIQAVLVEQVKTINASVDSISTFVMNNFKTPT